MKEAIADGEEERRERIRELFGKLDKIYGPVEIKTSGC